MTNRFNSSTLGYIVVGDIHGDMNQFIHPLFTFLAHLDKYQKIIYLGDYTDRGFSTPRIYELISAIHKCKETKDRIIFLKGNHECTDDCTYDVVQNMITCKYDTFNDARIKSYMYKHMHSLDLDIVYYDDLLNIVFSHSPMSKPLTEVLKLNDSKHIVSAAYANTTTTDKPNSKMIYQNIHGHDHMMSSTDDIKAFESGELKMISIDGDASIAFDLYEKRFDYTKYVDAVGSTAIVYNSKVIYLTITFDESTSSWKYKMCNQLVPLASKLDINSMPIEVIAKTLSYISDSLTNVTNEDKNMVEALCKAVGGITMKTSCDEFVKFYLQEFPGDPEFKNVFQNIRQHSIDTANSNKQIRTYFIDVPREVYRMIGIKSAIPRNELVVFVWIMRALRLHGGNIDTESSTRMIALVVQMLTAILIVSVCVSCYVQFRNRMIVRGAASG